MVMNKSKQPALLPDDYRDWQCPRCSQFFNSKGRGAHERFCKSRQSDFDHSGQHQEELNEDQRLGVSVQAGPAENDGEGRDAQTVSGRQRGKTVTICLLGRNGSGKEVLAEHNRSVNLSMHELSANSLRACVTRAMSDVSDLDIKWDLLHPKQKQGSIYVQMADDTQLLQHVSKKSTNPPAIFFSMRPSSNSKSGVNISRLAGGTAGWQLGTAPEVAAHAGIFGHTSVAEDEESLLCHNQYRQNLKFAHRIILQHYNETDQEHILGQWATALAGKYPNGDAPPSALQLDQLPSGILFLHRTAPPAQQQAFGQLQGQAKPTAGAPAQLSGTVHDLCGASVNAGDVSNPPAYTTGLSINLRPATFGLRRAAPPAGAAATSVGFAFTPNCTLTVSVTPLRKESILLSRGQAVQYLPYAPRFHDRDLYVVVSHEVEGRNGLETSWVLRSSLQPLSSLPKCPPFPSDSTSELSDITARGSNGKKRRVEFEEAGKQAGGQTDTHDELQPTATSPVRQHPASAFLSSQRLYEAGISSDEVAQLNALTRVHGHSQVLNWLGALVHGEQVQVGETAEDYGLLCRVASALAQQQQQDHQGLSFHSYQFRSVSQPPALQQPMAQIRAPAGSAVPMGQVISQTNQRPAGQVHNQSLQQQLPMSLSQPTYGYQSVEQQPMHLSTSYPVDHPDSSCFHPYGCTPLQHVVQQQQQQLQQQQRQQQQQQQQFTIQAHQLQA